METQAAPRSAVGAFIARFFAALQYREFRQLWIANTFAQAAAWGLIVAVLLALGSLPFFLGLTVVLPVLGHATWHLYRKVVEPDTSPRPDLRKERPRRSAADFPANLFPWTH